MKNTYLKCISLFSGENPKILIITNERKSINVSTCNQDAKTIDFISLSNELEKSILSNNDAKELYDLVILDQVCESPLLCEDLVSIWKTREEMFASLSKRINPRGCLIIFTQNAVNLYKISLLFNALINIFKRTGLPGTFLQQFTNELKAVNFSKFDYFYVYPDFESLINLISIERNTFQEVISLKYSLPLDAYRRPNFWLRWILSNSQLDRWLFRCQMIWVRK